MAATILILAAFYGGARALRLPPLWCALIGIFGFPALLVILGLTSALADWIRRSFVRPRRTRRIFARIAALDRIEAPDESYDEAFSCLTRLAQGVESRRVLMSVRRPLLFEEGKSRRYYLTFVVSLRPNAGALGILEEIADRWSDPLSRDARKALGR